MKILGIDCGGSTASVAISENGRILASAFADTSLLGIKHSALLAPLVKNLLADCNVSFADVDLFAVTNGPGSFTGVRIGAAFVKGLAFAENKPVAAVSSLEAAAFGDYDDNLVCVTIDARRGECYAALFKEGKRVFGDTVLSYNALGAHINDNFENKGVILKGDGAAKAHAELAPLIGNKRLTVKTGDVLAVSVCKIAEHTAPIAAKELLPSYLRPSSAERILIK
ncbi:MAG: tRNA (adenosine(37)-N6)-threonylcarbamoyltransferase complex dimerization subunit type 1 TsaB [Oscillospiraceae bacterium]|jgi:tRNA threonylcarbamoyladenosine biosynthesis protein TsaB|nr:tRNA (adenosine(37)-N6)-threonylcarbamoyltransferase complex dimerization subunit type 1 TsaB [Oscillospiraceae bacterium]